MKPTPFSDIIDFRSKSGTDLIEQVRVMFFDDAYFTLDFPGNPKNVHSAFLSPGLISTRSQRKSVIKFKLWNEFLL